MVQLPANVPQKAMEDGPSIWAPAPTWETIVKLLALGSVPVDNILFLFLSLSLSVALPLK